jgi:hypothetical protein
MAPVRVIFEKGITAQVIGSDWHIININGGRSEKIDNPGIIAKRYNVRPVIVTERSSNSCDYGNSPEFNLLLRTTVQDSFGLKITDWEQCAYKIIMPDKSTILDKIINIAYLLRATEYHCIQMALLYTEACSKMSKTSVIPGFVLNEIGQREMIFTNGGAEIYYEFDALITAVRRTYDSCRYLLWQFFGTNGSIPSSFHRTLVNCPSLPVTLKAKLNESWSKHGEEVTSYRDCIQHYVPIDFGISSLVINKFDDGALSTIAPIPNNPSAKSRFNFKYDMKKEDLTSGRDALTYGWEAANEVLVVATAILESVSVF